MATATDFTAALGKTLQFEGGYVHDPADPGGATNKGITQKTYAAWLGVPVDQADVRAITDAEVQEIYWNDYWLKSGADALPMPLALYHFDAAVNTGVTQANAFLRQSGGDPATYLALRKAFYERLATQRPDLAKFLNGWLKRVDSLSAATVGLSLLGIAFLVVAGWYLWRSSHGRA